MTDLSQRARSLDKIRALLKSVAAPCETSGKDPNHTWRKCRHCLALQELDYEDMRIALGEFLQAEAGLQEALKPLHLCAEHQPDQWESDGACPLCEAGQIWQSNNRWMQRADHAEAEVKRLQEALQEKDAEIASLKAKLESCVIT